MSYEKAFDLDEKPLIENRMGRKFRDDDMFVLFTGILLVLDGNHQNAVSILRILLLSKRKIHMYVVYHLLDYLHLSHTHAHMHDTHS